ncbi:hypothetical protein VTO42DRAFT_5472 [Malbranchea cinnamomea]
MEDSLSTLCNGACIGFFLELQDNFSKFHRSHPPPLPYSRFMTKTAIFIRNRSSSRQIRDGHVALRGHPSAGIIIIGKKLCMWHLLPRIFFFFGAGPEQSENLIWRCDCWTQSLIFFPPTPDGEEEEQCHPKLGYV